MMRAMVSLAIAIVFAGCAKPKPQVVDYGEVEQQKQAQAGPAKRTASLPQSDPKVRQGAIIYFDLDSDRLKGDIDTDHLALAKRVTVTGHACPLGSESHNITLSRKRAEAVAYNLVKSGLPPEIVKVDYKGEFEPVPGDYPKSRRAVITFTLR